jgi:hypothetical protein
MAQPAQQPLDIYRGDTGHWRLRLWDDAAGTQPHDLTGTTVAAQIRAKPGAPVLADLVCTVTLPNTVDIVLEAAASAAITAKAGAWDLEVTDAAGAVNTPVAGAVTITEDITRTEP